MVMRWEHFGGVQACMFSSTDRIEQQLRHSAVGSKRTITCRPKFNFDSLMTPLAELGGLPD